MYATESPLRPCGNKCGASHVLHCWQPLKPATSNGKKFGMHTFGTSKGLHIIICYFFGFTFWSSSKFFSSMKHQMTSFSARPLSLFGSRLHFSKRLCFSLSDIKWLFLITSEFFLDDISECSFWHCVSMRLTLWIFRDCYQWSALLYE